MKKLLGLICFSLIVHCLAGQSFEISELHDVYKGLIGETIKAPVKIKNTSDKAITLVIRKVTSEIGGTQKNYFCLENNCLDQKIEDFIFKVDAGQTYNLLQIALEAGLASGTSHIKYIAFNRSNPAETIEFDLAFMVEEKAEKENIYASRHFTLHNVYPNPVEDHAFVDYKIMNDQVKAKIVVHNILGNPIEEYPLPPLENKVKISASSLSAGIYFYTLYLDDEGVITRKLIVKK